MEKEGLAINDGFIFQDRSAKFGILIGNLE